MKPVIKAAQEMIAAQLPVRRRWVVNGTPIDFDFSARTPAFPSLPAEWFGPDDSAARRLRVFGEQDVAEGGGSRSLLCVDEEVGSVWGYDPEREPPLFPLNSSLDRFIATFRFLDDCWQSSKSWPPDCEERLRAIDAAAYPESDWQDLVAYLNEI